MRKEFNTSLEKLKDGLKPTEKQRIFQMHMPKKKLADRIRDLMFNTADVAEIHDLQSPQAPQRVVEVDFAKEYQSLGRITVAGKQADIHEGDILLWRDGTLTAGFLVFDIDESDDSYEMFCMRILPIKHKDYTPQEASRHYQIECVAVALKEYHAQPGPRPSH